MLSERFKSKKDNCFYFCCFFFISFNAKLPTKNYFPDFKYQACCKRPAENYQKPRRKIAVISKQVIKKVRFYTFQAGI